jgi:hypothetical protein
MRAWGVIALSVAGAIAGVAAAAAADLPRPYSTRYSAIGQRTAPLVIYDDEPGVVVRAYWLPPWRHRHYFPATGELPGIGREEDFTAGDPAPPPAENFERYWSTSFVRERPRAPDEGEPLPPLK